MNNIFNLSGEDLSIAQHQDKEQDLLMQRQNVVGVAVSRKIKDGRDTGDPCLTVYVEHKIDKKLVGSDNLIPSTVGKFKTDVVEIGVLMAGAITATRKQRPVQPGISVGHFGITAGTIGACVKPNTPGGVASKYYILSNNHVLAKSNAASIGDPVLQPGAFDDGVNPNDIVARLSAFVPINFATGTTNLVDCAIAEADFNILDREINWIGYCNGMGTAAIGMPVQKSGRTTGHTTGTVSAINGTVNVNYGAAGVARFVNQIITSPMSAGGDSGSLVLDMNNIAIGLLFAGSGAATICNPIAPVMSSLGIKFI